MDALIMRAVKDLTTARRAVALTGAGISIDSGIPPFRETRDFVRKVLALYADKGWKPIIAPEVEFYLVSQNADPDFPLTPPVGQSGPGT